MTEFDGMLAYKPEECGFESHLGKGNHETFRILF